MANLSKLTKAQLIAHIEQLQANHLKLRTQCSKLTTQLEAAQHKPAPKQKLSIFERMREVAMTKHAVTRIVDGAIQYCDPKTKVWIAV